MTQTSGSREQEGTGCPSSRRVVPLLDGQRLAAHWSRECLPSRWRSSVDNGTAPIAWMRQAPSSPAARNLLGLIERMQAVRAVGLDRNGESAPPAAVFDFLAGEGLRMTVQHLRDLARPRRTATAAATAIHLETELADATLLMFDKLMGGLSRRAEHGRPWTMLREPCVMRRAIFGCLLAPALRSVRPVARLPDGAGPGRWPQGLRYAPASAGSGP